MVTTDLETQGILLLVRENFYIIRVFQKLRYDCFII